jgi:cytochrome P450
MTDPLPFNVTPDAPVDDDVDYDTEYIPDFHARLGSLRDEKGVVRLQFSASTGIVVLRHADAYEMLSDESRFSKSEAFRPLTFPFMGPNIQGYDGHEHTVKRALVSPAFRRIVIPTYVEPIFRPIAEELVTEFESLGTVDLMDAFAKKYPMRITNRLLGIPPDDEQQMAAWAIAMLDILGDPEGSLRANAQFAEYVKPLLEERRAHPGEDILSSLVTEEVEGQRLNEDEVLGFLRLLFPAGVDTTWLTLGSMMYAVMQHPELYERLLADETERSWAVEETLRWEAAVGIEPRLTLQDVTLSGVDIPAGELVRMCLPAANRDPLVFPHPDGWELDRRPTNHIAFGRGRHLCLGANLARGELATALEVLLRRLPNLRLLEEPRITGTVLRGPRSMRVAWDPA